MNGRNQDALQSVFDAVASGNLAGAQQAMALLALGASGVSQYRDMVYLANRRANPLPRTVDPVPLKLPVEGCAVGSMLSDPIPA